MDKFDPNEHLVDLKGKKYLPVAPRVAWFRQNKPCWRINTELVEFKHENNYGIAVFMCKIYDENGNVISTGYGSETLSDFRDYFEKAETKAIGRALAALGYGTLFALELDEGKAIADAPQAPAKPQIVPCDECGLGIPRDIAVSTYKLYGKNYALLALKQSKKKRWRVSLYNTRYSEVND